MAYEIEIKSLLGDEGGAERLRSRMLEVDPDCKLISKGSQLNHYFVGGGIKALVSNAASHLSRGDRGEFESLAGEGNDFSVRTRSADGQVMLVVKASVDDTTSANGIARREFEAAVNLTLDELDQVLLDSGYAYQAKWSREREEYTCRGKRVCLDRNAGYGYVAELEKVIEDGAEAITAQSELRSLLTELQLEELPQERLERMFAYYNKNWPNYYGTTDIFVLE